ncbi:MAG: ABC transporter ATP-binding protein [SAR202 cluster bacterium]|jgi:putative ABC transport system ATP-binding protein|nr:ABC transporter ATP-binding protein [SAR202 cluster bacterium]
MFEPQDGVVPKDDALIRTIDLSKDYMLGADIVKALSDINFQVYPGQFVAIVGRSGSGKTTLLNIMAGLDKPTSGSVVLRGKDIGKMGEKDLTQVRRHTIGFIFQSFGLLPLLSAFENVELPLRIAGVGAGERQSRTREMLEMVGLWERANHRPYELSGGEQQRVSIARAIVNRPPLVLADEPTGELDSNNARSIFGLFKDMVKEKGISVVSATHDSTLLSLADEVKEIRNGQLEDSVVSESPERFR